MFTHTKKGFTLIELLVVIAIIGILSSVVLASLNTARQKSRDARRISDMKQIQLALELYFDTNRTYVVAAEGAASTALTAALVPTFIAAIPSDPISTGTQYQYEGTATDYCVGADMEATTGLPVSTCAGVVIDNANISYEVGP